MKKQFLLTGLMLLIALTLSANILTVNNNSPSPGQYTTLSSAISAASAGDTILVQGSPYSYTFGVGGLTVNKPITIIGPGYAPIKQNALPAILNYGSYGMAIRSNHVTIRGVRVQGTNVDINTVSNITISDCLLELDILVFNSTNVVISNNLIAYNSSNSIRVSSSSFSWNSNLTIRNNIFNAGSGITCEGSASYLEGVTIQNNTILGPASSTASFINTAGKARYWSFYNNIFWNRNAQANCIDCAYVSNLSYSSISDPLVEIPNTGLNTGNISGNPQFVNYPGGNYGSTQDFHLNPGSPAINAGSDGTDIGTYGSATPHTDHGMPNIPIMYSMEIPVGAVPVGGNIQVTFESHIQN